MALTQYTTSALVKGRLDITDSTDDTVISSVIDSVSRAIDNETGRYFGVDATTSTRYFTAQDTDRLYTDEISTATELEVYTDDDGDGTYETTWSATDYNLGPYNAALKEWPYEFLEVSADGSYTFPRIKKAVKIVAKFGWAAVPAPIAAAALLQSERIFKRFDTPLGAAASNALGIQQLQFPKLDPDVMQLIAPYRRVLDV